MTASIMFREQELDQKYQTVAGRTRGSAGGTCDDRKTYSCCFGSSFGMKRLRID